MVVESMGLSTIMRIRKCHYIHESSRIVLFLAFNHNLTKEAKLRVYHFELLSYSSRPLLSGLPTLRLVKRRPQLRHQPFLHPHRETPTIGGMKQPPQEALWEDAITREKPCHLLFEFRFEFRLICKSLVVVIDPHKLQQIVWGEGRCTTVTRRWRLQPVDVITY